MPKQKQETHFKHYGFVDGTNGSTPHLVSVSGFSLFFTQLSIACREDGVELGPKAKAFLEEVRAEMQNTNPFEGLDA